MEPITTREEWLTRAIPQLRSLITAAGGKDFAPPLVSVGFPSARGLSAKHRAIGECWSERCTDTHQSTVMISPLLCEPVEVLGVLLHELIHASAGVQCKHRGEFKRIATDCGLIGKMTATQPGEPLAMQLHAIAEGIGEYPHVRLNASAIDDERKKQKTRLRLYECNACGQKIRAASDTLAAIHIGEDGEMCGIFTLNTPEAVTPC